MVAGVQYASYCPHDQEQPWEFVHILDLDDWLVFTGNAVILLDSDPVLQAPVHGVAAKIGHSDSLLVTCARTGFTGVTKTALERLHKHLEMMWPDPKPRLEMDLVFYMVQAILQCSDEEAHECCRRRNPKKSALFKSSIDESNKKLVEEIAIGDDEEVDRAILRPQRRADAAAGSGSNNGGAANGGSGGGRSHMPGGAPEHKGGSGSGASSSNQPGPGADHSQPPEIRTSSRTCPAVRPIVGENFTRAAANELKPPAVGCRVDLHQSRNAWQAHYRDRVTVGYKSHSSTWGGDGELTHRAALMQVLRWAWDRHVEAFPEAVCPFDLSD